MAKNEPTIKTSVDVIVEPFCVPNFVSASKGEGRITLSLHIRELDTTALSYLCDKFREAVFQKAERQDPRKK